MLRKGWFRWLIPGLNIKRWLALFSCGVGLLIIGISLIFNYQWLAVLEDIVLAFSYNMTGFYNYNVLIAVGAVVLSIGAVLMLIGTSKVIKTIIRAVLPNPDSKVSDIIFQNIKSPQCLSQTTCNMLAPNTFGRMSLNRRSVPAG